MKQWLWIGMFGLSSSCFAQKQVVVGTATVSVKGEKVIAYNELGLYATETNWVEVYLYSSADSVIVYELQSKLESSATCDYVYMYGARKADLDLEKPSIEKHDMIREPANLSKVMVNTRNASESVQLEAWSANGAPESFPMNGFRIIVRDEAQALDIIRQLKAE